MVGSTGIYLKACRRQEKELRGGRKRESVMFRSRSKQVPRKPTSYWSFSYRNNSALGTGSPERSEVNNMENDCPQLAIANYRDHSRQTLTYVSKFFFSLSCL